MFYFKVGYFLLYSVVITAKIKKKMRTFKSSVILCGSLLFFFGRRGGKMALLIIKVADPWFSGSD